MSEKIKIAKIIKEDKHLFFEDKIELIKMIKNMNESEVKLIEQHVRLKQAASLAGLTTQGFGFGSSYKLYKAAFDKCAGSCGVWGVNGPKRQMCMAKCKVIMAQNQLEYAKKTNNPKVIAKAQKNLQAKEAYFNKMKAWMEKRGKNGDLNVNVNKTNIIRTQK